MYERRSLLSRLEAAIFFYYDVFVFEFLPRFLTSLAMAYLLQRPIPCPFLLSHSLKKVKWADASHATWAQFGDYCHLRLFMKNDLPPVRLDGFSKSQHSGRSIAFYAPPHLPDF